MVSINGINHDDRLNLKNYLCKGRFKELRVSRSILLREFSCSERKRAMPP